MSSRWIALAIVALLASQEANAACVISGARPTVPLPTMVSGQEFSFIASRDCETLRFTIRGTDLSKRPMSGGPVGPGPQTYKVVLTESEWNAVVAESGSTLTWVVTGRTSASVITRMVTTNDLKRDAQVTIDLSMADAKLVGEDDYDYAGIGVSGAGDVNSDGHDDLLVGAWENDEGGGRAGAAYLVLGPVTGTLDLSRGRCQARGRRGGRHAAIGVSGAGDMDGDGHDDVLVGAPFNDEGGHFAGAAYLVLGPVTGTFDLSLADAKLVGEEEDDHAGYGLSGAGDVDGDGHDDVLVGAWNSEGGSSAGAAYLVLGPVTGTLDLSSADAKLVGEDAYDLASAARAPATWTATDTPTCWSAHPATTKEATSPAPPTWCWVPSRGRVDLSVADAKLVGEETYDYAGMASRAQETWTATATTTCWSAP